MAGRARTKALAELLDTRAAEYFEIDYINGDDPRSSLDYVCEWVESGNTLKELAASLSTELEHEVTYARLMAVLREQHGAQACDAALESSRRRASHSLAETAMELVDAPADSNVDVSRAASRARTRQWMAERYNPQQYGQSKGVSVTVTVGSLHLDALRAVPARATAIVTGSPEQHALPAGGAIVTTK
jgi:hypothetical protein